MYLSVFMGPVAMTPAQDRPLIDQSLAMAEAAAEAGFAMVTFGEQHFSNYEPYCNPFLMAARLSPVLGDTWFATTIVPLPFHGVLRLAEEASVVDLLTRGRFVLGLSAGRAGYGSDYPTFAVPEDRRDEVFESKLELLLRAFRQEVGDDPLILDTEWDHGRLSGRMMPAPYRHHGPQIAIGTNTDEKIDHVARRGVPLFLGPCRPTAAAAKLHRHREGMAAAGFSEAQVAEAAKKSLVTRHVVVGETDEAAWAMAERLGGRNPLMDRSVDQRSFRELSQVAPEAFASDPFPRNPGHVQAWYCVGSPESVTEQLLAYPEMGVQQVNTRFQFGTYNPDLVDSSFKLFVDEVLPGLKPELFQAPAGDEIAPVNRPGVDVMAPPKGAFFVQDTTTNAPQ